MSLAIRRISIAALPMLMLGACNRESAAPPEANQAASAEVAGRIVPAALTKADGTPAGSVSVEDTANGVNVTIAASGLPQGVHGIHLHAAGKCEGPKFQSAGAHWNPTSRKHGRDNPQGAHLGDLANLEVGADGKGGSTFLIAATRTALADADGTALAIHAEVDDYKTDPSGNSGDRIACAVISPPK